MATLAGARDDWRLGGFSPLVWLLAASALFPAAALAQQLTADEQAAMVLAAGRRAYQERNYPTAADRFREFLRQWGGHKDATAARYGLGLTLIEGPQKDYNAAIEALNGVVGNQAFAERPIAFYYLATCYRAQGRQALETAAAKPNEAEQYRSQAKQRFEQALPHFVSAAAGFDARIKAAADAPARLRRVRRRPPLRVLPISRRLSRLKTSPGPPAHTATSRKCCCSSVNRPRPEPLSTPCSMIPRWVGRPRAIWPCIIRATPLSCSKTIWRQAVH